MQRHRLDVHPNPRDKAPLYINEPWIIDKSLLDAQDFDREPGPAKDNVRVYIPLDLNSRAILWRLNEIVMRYGESNEENESDFGAEVMLLIAQIEIYDQVWSARHMPPKGEHSREAVELVRGFVSQLEEIPDGCSEIFPFNVIDELKQEYLE